MDDDDTINTTSIPFETLEEDPADDLEEQASSDAEPDDEISHPWSRPLPTYRNIDHPEHRRFCGEYKFRRVLNGILCVAVAVLVIVLVRNLDLHEDSVDKHEDVNYVHMSASATAKSGMVAADHETCSELGRDVMKKGGNAIDAAVTTVLCGGVMRPFESGVGGGAIINLRLANGTSYIFDSREMAPAFASEDMFSSPEEAAKGGLSIAVPGELKGLELIWKRFGTLDWKDLILPVADLAEGYKVDKLLAEAIQSHGEGILKGTMKPVYAPDGKLLKKGDTIKMPALAATFRTIAKKGTDALYTGSIGQNLVSDIQKAGGNITMADLNRYSVAERKPLVTFYHGYEVISAPAPFGGPVVTMILNILERYQLVSLDPLLKEHWVCEAMKFAFSDRRALGDPLFEPSVTKKVMPTMTSKDHAASLRQKLKPDISHGSSFYKDIPVDGKAITDHGTAHFAVVDKHRNAVSITSTVNLGFGSEVLSASTGILLNDQMDDFSTAQFPNYFGLVPAKPNFIKPGKRPLSSMSPTVVTKDNELYLVVGAAGGPRIITATLQTILNVLDLELPLPEAVSYPRIHHQLYPTKLSVEAALPSHIQDGLKHKNHSIAVLAKDSGLGNAQAILIQDDDTVIGVTDWRRGGRPAGYS